MYRYKVRRIVVRADVKGHVWYDKRWKWYRTGIGVRMFRKGTKVGDVIRYIARYYCVAEDDVELHDAPSV